MYAIMVLVAGLTALYTIRCVWMVFFGEPRSEYHAHKTDAAQMIALAPLELAGRDPHELLRTMPFIRFDRKQWGGQQVDNYLRITNIAPRERIELSHLTAIATLVGRGVGVALVPDTVMPTTITARIVRLQLPVATRPRQLGILWQRSSIHGKLINLFVNQATILCQSSDID